MDFTETPEYQAGRAWADANLARLRERYSGKQLDTDELRSFLWAQATRLYPEQRESLENNLRQTLWVAGAIRRLVDTMAFSSEGFFAIWDIAAEMGSILGAERTAQEHLESLKKKTASWWRQRLGDVSPADVLKAVYSRWWREVGNPKNRTRTTKWEALIHGFGAREMAALDTAVEILKESSGPYRIYSVRGEKGSMEIIAEDVWERGRLIQGAGDIIG